MIQLMLAALPGGDSTGEGEHPFLRGGEERRGQRNHLYRNLNKQKINIQHFYKLQHYGTVECINYKGGGVGWRIYSIYQVQL